MKVLRDNLLSALRVAIFHEKIEEKKLTIKRNNCQVEGSSRGSFWRKERGLYRVTL